MDRTQPLRLLMVEDSEDDALVLLRHLRRGGYEVTSERVDTPTAMSTALAKQWDLVVCDYHMPKFSGAEALSLLRSTCSETPFIFVSGQIGEDNAVAALKQGAQDYVMKGNLKRLIPAIERELRAVEQRRERKKLEQQVMRLEKFEAIGRLAGGIAHDFNNVAGVVLGLAQLGYEEAPSGGRLRERFQKICDQARYAAGLTAQLLAFARRQILQPRTLSLNDVILQAASLLETAIGVDIEFHTVLAPDLRSINADPTQMQQMLINLCLNARDAMPQRGRLTIETHNADIGDEYNPDLSVPSCPGSYVLVKVSDTGIGMDAATVEHIFEPFFTTKEEGHGTGLGLATVYGIVTQHWGFIGVTSEPGRGTTFSIYLPAVAEVSPVPEPVIAEQPAANTGTILVAEDFEELRELAFEILSPLGYRVILASNGVEAVRMFQADADDIQLVIMDVGMPQLGGIEAYSKMREIKPGLPVIFMTGRTEESPTLKAAIQQGAAFLQKPYMPDVLTGAVRTTLRKRTGNG